MRWIASSVANDSCVPHGRANCQNNMPHPAQVQFSKPDAGQVERGGKYVSFIDNAPASSGAILSGSNTPRWHFETRPKRGARHIANLLRKPDFIFSDTEHREILRISRERRFPARFNIIEKNQI